MDVARALILAAERTPDRVAVGGPQPLTYRQWDIRTNRIGRVLADVGVDHGARIVLLLSNGELMASTHLAAQKLGAISTPLNIRLSPDEIAYCVDDAAPAAVVSDDATAPLVAEVLKRVDASPPLLHAGDEAPDGARPFERLIDQQTDAPLEIRIAPEDISVMLYTSGTTGKPKGVPRSHRAEVMASLAHVFQAGYGWGERTLGAMPMYHTMGIRSLLSVVQVGGRFVPLESFDAATALERIQADDVTALYLVPTAYWSLLQQPNVGDAAASVRKLGFAGAPMTSSLTEQLVATFRPEVFVNHYGSTEIYTFTVDPDAAAKPGSAGKAGIFSRMRVVRAESDERVGPDAVVAPGETGELIASLSSCEAFGGYWHRPDADERARRDGWYFTGDLGYVADDGDHWVVGRVDDMVITGGENVYPTEVEDVLARAPGVAEVCIAGLPDEKWGQAVTAFVVPNQDALITNEALEGWIHTASGLASYKRPKRVVLVREIPKSPVGKVLRRKLVAGDFDPIGDP